MIITITGDLGSGKSTLGENLAQKLDFKRFYIGQILRDKAKERGMTIGEYTKLAETDSNIDREVDDYQKKLGEEKDDFVIEGRTSWFLIPHSIKLYLKVDSKIGAERIFADLKKNKKRNEERHVKSVDDILKSNQKRAKSEKFRYQKYYGKNCSNKNDFDFVIDTTILTPKEVLEQTLEFIEAQNK